MSLAWEEIPHTADWALRVRGDDLRALFENAALGMVSLIGGEVSQDAGPIERDVTLEAPDLEILLVDWLTGLLVMVEDEAAFIGEIHVIEVDSPSQPGAARMQGRVMARPGGAFTKHIKAVTYHNLAVRRTDQGFETTIVFDV